MNLPTQSPFWHNYLQSLLMTTPCPQCHLVQRQVPSISFTPEDMFLKDNEHDRPLYYTGYIGSTYIERIQVDPGSTLSIILKRLLYFLDIQLSRLSTTTTTIYGFNAGSSHPLARSVFDAILETWNQKYRVTSLTQTHLTTSFLVEHRSMPTGSSHPLCINASNMWAMMLWFKRCSPRCNYSKE